MIDKYVDNKTGDKFFITSDPDVSDSFKNEKDSHISSNIETEPVKHLEDPPKKFLPPISDLKTSTTTSLNSKF